MSRSWERIGRRNARPDIAILPANLGGAVRQIDGDPVQIWRAAFGCEIEGQLVHVRPCASAGDVPPHSPIVCPHHGEGMTRNLIDESHAGKAGRPNVVVGIDEGPMVERSAGQLGEERKHGRPHRDPANLRGAKVYPNLAKSVPSERARCVLFTHIAKPLRAATCRATPAFASVSYRRDLTQRVAWPRVTNRYSRNSSPQVPRFSPKSPEARVSRSRARLAQEPNTKEPKFPAFCPREFCADRALHITCAHCNTLCARTETNAAPARRREKSNECARTRALSAAAAQSICCSSEHLLQLAHLLLLLGREREHRFGRELRNLVVQYRRGHAHRRRRRLERRRKALPAR